MFASTWDGKVGVSDCMPLPGPVWDEFEWPDYSYREWARQTQVSVPMLRRYALAVYDASDNYLASLDEATLQRELDLSSMGYGKVTVAWVVSKLVIGHAYSIAGEIACLKGLQGLKGYPQADT